MESKAKSINNLKIKKQNERFKNKPEKKKSEIQILEERIKSETPPSSASKLLNPELFEKLNTEAKKIKLFSQLPLSSKTKKGLKDANFNKMTDIQRESIMQGLSGRDILGAAKTGSGKTLAFLIPVLESLFRKNWVKEDGLGALIISPTRELSLQIFKVLKIVGRNHNFSAGLAIGGLSKGLKLSKEKQHVTSMNILICTPGRLLQHMDETPMFSCDNLQVLVLDEADRLLDLGFEKELDAIIANLPPTRQTLLFSATQTKSVEKLAKLSLISPEFIEPHLESSKATPSKLMQQYIIVEAHEKLELLYTFLKTHLNSKILIFITSRKQAVFLFEMFRRLRPGIPLSCIHGKMSQSKRIKSLEKFQQSKKGCLITTDVCSRGLDIRGANWVINFDCPENVETYIHRVGRTARNKAHGFALLFLLPSEKRMVDKIKSAKIPIACVKMKMQRKDKELRPISTRFAKFLAEDSFLKLTAQRAASCYLRSVEKMRDKEVFDISKINVQKFCLEMGLQEVPILSKVPKAKRAQNKSHALSELIKGNPIEEKIIEN